jgi:hypothetical protein
VYQRRPEVLPDDSRVLRLHDRDDAGGLQLLHDDEQHAGLLRLLLTGVALRLALAGGRQRRRPLSGASER